MTRQRLDPLVEACVERICNRGCREVRREIVALQQGQIPDEASELNHHQRREVLRELQLIMAVYGDECRI